MTSPTLPTREAVANSKREKNELPEPRSFADASQCNTCGVTECVFQNEQDQTEAALLPSFYSVTPVAKAVRPRALP